MKHAFLFILIISSILVFSQSSNKNFIGITVGPSFPLGNLAKMDLADSTSGYAKTGVAIDVNYGHRFTHNIGIQVSINYSSNSVDIINYKNDLEARHPDTMFSVVNPKNWNGGGILVGPYLRLPISENFSWDFRALFGAFGGDSPTVTIEAYTDTETLPSYLRQSGSSFSWAYSLGTGFKYKVSNYYVLLFVDYVNSPQTYKNVTGWDWDQQPYKITVKQDYRYIAATIGLGYFF